MQGVVEVDQFTPPDEDGAWDFFVSFTMEDSSGWSALDWITRLGEWDDDDPPIHLTALGMRGDEEEGETVVFDFFCEVDGDADLASALGTITEYNFHMCPNCTTDTQDEITEIERWLAAQSGD